MLDLIFVYGTLMRSVPSAASRWLTKYATFVDMGQISGCLFDLGRYPGLVLDGDKQFVITGEIHRLLDPAEGLAFLDRYEGLDSAFPEYERVCKRLEDGTSAWLYHFIGDHSDLVLIPEGDYQAYYKSQAKHKFFMDTPLKV